jgi:hypothetical protein
MVLVKANEPLKKPANNPITSNRMGKTLRELIM